jgi:hypothetical protein
MRAIVIAVVAITACAQNDTSSDDCTVSKGGQCCDGRGCATGPGTLSLTVLDAATSQPIDGQLMATSSTYEGPLPFMCSTAASPCPSWELAAGPLGLSSGSLQITLSASGYQPLVYTAMLSEPTGCCGWGDTTFATVSLTK